MKRLLSLFLFLTTPLIADSSGAYPPNPYEVQGGKRSPTFSKANAQAIYWINLIDQYQFTATWLEAADIVKDITTREQWGAAMQSTRSGLGTVSSRKVSSHQATTNLPGGLKGNFMIITYQTNFSKRANQIETITLMTEGDLGLWKVIAYHIGDNR